MRATLLASLVALMLISGIAVADPSGDAIAKVYVEVVPNIAVGVVDAVVNLGQVQTGTFGGAITFRIDANTEQVDMWVAATDLFKGDEYSEDPEVSPIAVNTAAGALVKPMNGNRVGGAGNTLQYTGATTINGWAANATETGRFESGQNGHFSQDVDVTVKWNQPDDEKPQGEYSGYVMLTALVVP